MDVIIVSIVMLILLSGGAYYGYQAGYYDVRGLGGSLFVIIAVLFTFFVLASGG
jgi:hypothetical protein